VLRLGENGFDDGEPEKGPGGDGKSAGEAAKGGGVLSGGVLVEDLSEERYGSGEGGGSKEVFGKAVEVVALGVLEVGECERIGREEQLMGHGCADGETQQEQGDEGIDYLADAPEVVVEVVDVAVDPVDARIEGSDAAAAGLNGSGGV